MLKLYYTTTKGQEEEQQKPTSSLGGYRASNLFKNDAFNNCFADLSTYTVKNNNQVQYIALILKSEDSGTSNINLWFEFPKDTYSNLSVAAVDLSTDSDGFQYMENVPTIHSSPTLATFHEADTETNKVNLGDLDSGAAMGIWIKREILADAIIADLDDFVIEDPGNSDRVIQKELGGSDIIEMKMSYD